MLEREGGSIALFWKEIKIGVQKLSAVCMVLGVCYGLGFMDSHPGCLLWRVEEEEEVVHQ